MRIRRVAFVPMSLLIGCSFLVETSGVSNQSAAPAVDSSTALPPEGGGDVESTAVAPDAASAAGVDGSTCPTGRGPSMVRVADSTGTFCIDSTEVTNAQFNALLADDKRPVAPPVCAYRTTYGGAMRPSDAMPVTSVDWCEAWMFCAWAGKRLCGSRSGAAIADFAPANDPTVSEWFAACSHSGRTKFPYGDAGNASLCNGCDRTGPCASDGGAITPVASLAECQGGYPGIFDMSGNVVEWEDNCNVDQGTSQLQQCPPRGGDVTIVGANLECTLLITLPAFHKRGERSRHNGIRCCAD